MFFATPVPRRTRSQSGSRSRQAWIAVGLTALTLALGAGVAFAQTPAVPRAATSTYSILRTGNRNVETGDTYLDREQKVIGARCAVCHSCTNGPCQLNLTSYAGIERGINQQNPYSWGWSDTRHTRLSDNLSTATWRERGFTPVLPATKAEAASSLFLKALRHGDANDPASPRFKNSTLRALADRHERMKYTCPATSAEYDKFQEKYPMSGMPWALPKPETTDRDLIEAWVLAGATGPSNEAKTKVTGPQKTTVSVGEPAEVIASWDAFLNGSSLESQLVARYIYEHSFVANIQFAENPGEFYRIVRAKNAHPGAIDRVASEMPQDDPGVARVYYRLEKVDRIIEGKTHILWALSLKDLAHLQDLFFGSVGGSTWRVGTPTGASKPALPGYTTVNPFEYFDAIPVVARARFMIENSRLIYQSFARGPICMGQQATYAGNEYAWLWFLRPESDPTVQTPKLGLPTYKSFFPSTRNDTPILWGKHGEEDYRTAFEATLRALKPGGLSIDDIWLGESWEGSTRATVKTNSNAWLQTHRNQISTDFTNSSIMPLTGIPRQTMIISYANFERMYYNAGVSYKYFGGVKHQNDSFNLQTYTRTEGEDLYASLYASQATRTALRAKYTSVKGRFYNQLGKDYSEGRPSPNTQTTEDALYRAVYAKMKASGVILKEDTLNNWPGTSVPDPAMPPAIADFERGLRSLTAREAPYARFVPNIVHIRLGGINLYTLLANRGYSNDKMDFAEGIARMPEMDEVVAVPGFSGFQPHLFIDLPFDRAAAFLTTLGAVESPEDWRALHASFAISRNSAKFWAFVDWLHAWMETNMPAEAAILDLREYDKDEVPF